MGTTLGNIHLYARGACEQVHSETVEILRHYMDSLQFVEVTQPEAQTAIIVASETDQPWITVYLGIHLDREPVALLLSQPVRRPVLLVEVFDSDVVTLTLYENGQQVDVFSNWINYESTPKRRAGHAARWRAVLPEDQTPESLAQAWKTNREDYPFESEGILERVVDLLELDADRVWFEPRSEQLPPDYRVTHLFFRPR